MMCEIRWCDEYAYWRAIELGSHTCLHHVRSDIWEEIMAGAYTERNNKK